MYHPPSKDILLDFLRKLIDKANDHNLRRTLIDLYNIVLSVRPLKLLSRLCILKHLQWKDVGQLPLTQLLKKYISIGDIPPSHKIHKVISVHQKEVQ